MSQQILYLNTKSLSHTLAVYVPDEWAVEQMWAVLCSGGLYEDDIELMEDA